MPWKAYLALSSTIKLARCFIGLRVRLPSGICHQSMPSLYAKVSLFGLIRGVLPIFSQVPVLLNQELDSCFPWQTQGPGCPELPLVDGGRNGAPLLPKEVFLFKMSSLKISPPYLIELIIWGFVYVSLNLHYLGWWEALFWIYWYYFCDASLEPQLCQMWQHSLTLFFNSYHMAEW